MLFDAVFNSSHGGGEDVGGEGTALKIHKNNKVETLIPYYTISFMILFFVVVFLSGKSWLQIVGMCADLWLTHIQLFRS